MHLALTPRIPPPLLFGIAGEILSPPWQPSQWRMTNGKEVERANAFPSVTSSTTLLRLRSFLPFWGWKAPALSAKILHLIHFPCDGCLTGFKITLGNQMCMPRVKERSKELWVDCYRSTIFAKVNGTKRKQVTKSWMALETESHWCDLLLLCIPKE